MTMDCVKDRTAIFNTMCDGKRDISNPIVLQVHTINQKQMLQRATSCQKPSSHANDSAKYKESQIHQQPEHSRSRPSDNKTRSRPSHSQGHVAKEQVPWYSPTKPCVSNASSNSEKETPALNSYSKSSTSAPSYIPTKKVVPTYNPTPISVLSKSKKKQTISYSDSDSSYDPVTNFSAVYIPTPKHVNVSQDSGPDSSSHNLLNNDENTYKTQSDSSFMDDDVPEGRFSDDENIQTTDKKIDTKDGPEEDKSVEQLTKDEKKMEVGEVDVEEAVLVDDEAHEESVNSKKGDNQLERNTQKKDNTEKDAETIGSSESKVREYEDKIDLTLLTSSSSDDDVTKSDKLFKEKSMHDIDSKMVDQQTEDENATEKHETKHSTNIMQTEEGKHAETDNAPQVIDTLVEIKMEKCNKEVEKHKSSSSKKSKQHSESKTKTKSSSTKKEHTNTSLGPKKVSSKKRSSHSTSKVCKSIEKKLDKKHDKKSDKDQHRKHKKLKKDKADILDKSALNHQRSSSHSSKTKGQSTILSATPAKQESEETSMSHKYTELFGSDLCHKKPDNLKNYSRKTKQVREYDARKVKKKELREEKKKKQKKSKSTEMQDVFGGLSSDSDCEIVDLSEDLPDLTNYSDLHDLDALSKDEDIYDECLKVFNMNKSKPVPNLKVVKQQKNEVIEPLAPPPFEKKRTAHTMSQNASHLRKVHQKPFSRLTPVQVMHNRIVEMQKRKAQQQPEAPSLSKTTLKRTSTDQVPAIGSSLLQKRRRLDAGNSSVTIAGTDASGRRIAHTAIKPTSQKPMVKPEYGNKVPVNVRQRYLDEIYTSCLKLSQEQEAHNRAIKEELDVYNRSSTRNVYLNVAVNTVKRLRSELDSGPSTTNSASTSKTITRRPSKTVSHDAIIAGSKALKVPYTLNEKSDVLEKNINTPSKVKLKKPSVNNLRHCQGTMAGRIYEEIVLSDDDDFVATATPKTQLRKKFESSSSDEDLEEFYTRMKTPSSSKKSESQLTPMKEFIVDECSSDSSDNEIFYHKKILGAPRPRSIVDGGSTCLFLKSLSDSISDRERHLEACHYVANFQKTKAELTEKLFNLYNKSLFEGKLEGVVTVLWNKRLLKRAGYCACKRPPAGSTRRTCRVELSDKVCDNAERVRDTLIHELCHAAVWIISVNTNDVHGPLWKYWAKKANMSFPDLPIIRRCHSYSISYKYTYKCMCGYQFGRHSKSFDTQKKVCRHCFALGLMQCITRR